MTSCDFLKKEKPRKNRAFDATCVSKFVYGGGGAGIELCFLLECGGISVY